MRLQFTREYKMKSTTMVDAERLRLVIPEAMAKAPRWLLWKRKPRRNSAKFDKIPYYADGTIRESVQNRPEDLAKMANMDEALAAMGAHKASGVGFAFGPGCGFTAVDLDNCVVNGKPQHAILEAYGGYAEISPSGTGLRLITAYAEIGDFKNIPDGVEVFETTGFVTVTGNVLRDADIEPMPEAMRAAIEAHRPKTPPPRPPSRALGPVTDDEVQSALAAIPADCGYGTWIDLGMALRSEGVDLEVWDAWSATGTTYQGYEDCRKHWQSFNGTGITIRTLFHHAKQHGWSFRRQDEEKVLERLAALSEMDYDHEREDAAARLGVRTTTLDRQVDERRSAAREEDEGAGVEELEPWHEPVGGEVLDEVLGDFERHLVADQESRYALSLWTFGTFCYDAFSIYPKGFLSSPERRCGKSLAAEMVEANANRALMSSSITASAIFRAVEQWRPTLIIDEADRLSKDNNELTGIINAGHRKRTAFVIRSVKVGEEHQPRRFSVWAPMLLAAIGRMADTIMDRSVVIHLRRKSPDERVERLPIDLHERNRDRRRRCLRWARDNAGKLRSTQVQMPPHGNDRMVDNWLPLFTIAAVIGGEWPARAAQAFTKLSAEEEEDSIGPMLLADVRHAFLSRGAEALASKTLVDALVAMEDRPWSDWKRGKPMTQNSLAHLLSPFKIKSQTVRLSGSATARGYYRKQFSDAWSRYLSTDPPKQSDTVTQPSNGAASSRNQSDTTENNVSLRNRREPSNSADCVVVSLQKGETRKRYVERFDV
jgi:hypothetical protein